MNPPRGRLVISCLIIPGQQMTHEMELRITPSGRVVAEFPDGAESGDRRLQGVAGAFAEDMACGLFMLAALRSGNGLPPSVEYWRSFAIRCVAALCRSDASAASTPPPGQAEFASMLLSAPPMAGAEYLSVKMLESAWIAMDAWLRLRVLSHPDGLAGFLDESAPQFKPVGRICFHLAENKRDPDRPFAFMATYASGMSSTGQVRHLPLSRALEEYAGEGNREALLRLLSPVSAAADKSVFLRGLVDSGDVYHPVAWAPSEAYSFLCDVPVCEEAGIVVRVPDWWRKRPRPQVRATVGPAAGTRMSAEGLLSFSMDVALGDEKLSPGELKSLLASEGGLILLKGQWVEADTAKLKEAIEHWKQVEAMAGQGGITFIECMRLLAGAGRELGLEEDSAGSSREWSAVRAGEDLAAVLAGLRNPGSLSGSGPGAGLKTVLRPYQLEGLNWLRLLSGLGLGACLADDMGLGKTIQVIALLLDAKKGSKAAARKAGPALLVVPASLISNWKAEFTRFAPSLDVRYCHPSESTPDEMKVAESAITGESGGCGRVPDAVVCTYGMLTRTPWILKSDWGIAVLDEAQAIKNAGALQSRAAKRIRARARIALTGTPVENRLSDLWSIFDFLCPGLLGSAKKFKEFTGRLESREHDRYAPLKNLVGPYILRRLKTDRNVAPDLPDKTEVKVGCGLSKKQAALYVKLTDDLRRLLGQAEGMQRRGLVIAQLMRLKQLCNHPSQLLGDGDYIEKDSGKYARLREICEEVASRGEKALVFTQFREIAEPLSAFLSDVFGKHGLVLHGGTPVASRRRLVDAFQKEDGPPFFVLSIKAGGTGLNLTAASHVVLFDRWWNPAVESQAMDRAFRIGQSKNVLVHKFVCRGTVEERIDSMVEEKSGLAGEILDTDAAAKLTEMSDLELLDFVALDLSKTEL